MIRRSVMRRAARSSTRRASANGGAYALAGFAYGEACPFAGLPDYVCYWCKAD